MSLRPQDNAGVEPAHEPCSLGMPSILPMSYHMPCPHHNINILNIRIILTFFIYVGIIISSLRATLTQNPASSKFRIFSVLISYSLHHFINPLNHFITFLISAAEICTYVIGFIFNFRKRSGYAFRNV